MKQQILLLSFFSTLRKVAANSNMIYSMELNTFREIVTESTRRAFPSVVSKLLDPDSLETLQFIHCSGPILCSFRGENFYYDPFLRECKAKKIWNLFKYYSGFPELFDACQRGLNTYEYLRGVANETLIPIVSRMTPKKAKEKLQTYEI